MSGDRSPDAGSYDDVESAGMLRETQRGPVCVVTGASRGIGRATALGLAKGGATVVLVVRDEAAGERVRAEIERAVERADVSVEMADLASFASIRAAAARIASRFPLVHALVNNAGVNSPRRRTSADGIELTLAVNHLAPFLLTHELRVPLSRAAAAEQRHAKIVTVTSRFERFGRIAFDDLQMTRLYVGVLAYTQSKLANLLFTRALAKRVAGSGVVALSADPGLVATDLLRERAWYGARPLHALWRRVLRTPERGARASVLAALGGERLFPNGMCVDAHGRAIRTSGRARDDDAAERLWRVSEELTGARWDDR